MKRVGNFQREYKARRQWLNAFLADCNLYAQPNNIAGPDCGPLEIYTSVFLKCHSNDFSVRN